MAVPETQGTRRCVSCGIEDEQWGGVYESRMAEKTTTVTSEVMGQQLPRDQTKSLLASQQTHPLFVV